MLYRNTGIATVLLFGGIITAAQKDNAYVALPLILMFIIALNILIAGVRWPGEREPEDDRGLTDEEREALWKLQLRAIADLDES
jgi:hypothetical protein